MQTKDWVRYFERNAKEILRPEPDGYHLTDEERARIEKSIQGFQIGEASEGKHLRQGAVELARRTGNEDYPQAIGYLIREENRHSAYLGLFMRQHGIPFAKNKLSDAIFRALRRTAGIEVSVRVLVTAEIASLAYYESLAEATGSRVLQRICRRMVEEERKHIEFQMHHIHWMNLRKSLLRAAASNVAHAVLMAGTMLVVWLEHGRVLRVRHSFRSFCRQVWNTFLVSMYAGAASAIEEGGDSYVTAGVALRHA